jgi:nucleoside-diphosphate-sugar epimerase
MESLVETLPLDIITKANSMNSNIYVLGHVGYIGSHLLNRLSLLGYSIHSLDSRNFSIDEREFKAEDIFIDCSRIRNFDARTLQEDYIATVKLLEISFKFNVTYVRIGSVLEIDPQATSTPYIDWSRQRSKWTLSSLANLKSRLLLIPNIYGGTGSASIIDGLKSARQNGEEIPLKDPTSKRDFLSMNNFLAVIPETLLALPSKSSTTTILTSGFLYDVKSIQSFLKIQDLTVLRKESISYTNSGEIKVIKDSLVEYLLDY